MSDDVKHPDASPPVKLLPDGRPDLVSGSGNALGQSWLQTAKHWDRDRRRANRTAKNDPQENRRVAGILLHHALDRFAGKLPVNDREQAAGERVAAILGGRPPAQAYRGEV